MFVTQSLTAWHEAFSRVFHDPAYAGEFLREVHVGVEYPMQEAQYPGLWVNYSTQGDAKIAGIGHEEYVETTDGTFARHLRWQFGGLLQITVSCLSNLERARMIDELLTTIAVSQPGVNQQGLLREHIEQHDLIGQIVTWDSITVTGFGEMQGTPWGTDDVVYEATLSITCSGEVVMDAVTGAILPLRTITVAVERDDTY